MVTDYQVLSFSIWLHIRRDIDPYIFFLVVSYIADKTIPLKYLCLKNSHIVIIVYFEFIVP
jgi:hypothetical protein